MYIVNEWFQLQTEKEMTIFQMKLRQYLNNTALHILLMWQLESTTYAHAGHCHIQ